jgi:hypothetical protein
MWLFVVAWWCWAIEGQSGGPNIVSSNSRNSRFGEFNSRLGCREFPVRAATGIRSQRFDLPYGFRGQTTVLWGKSTIFSVRREKPGILSRRTPTLNSVGPRTI